MNRLVRPVMFAFEPDLVFVFGSVVFGAAGAPTLNQGPYPKIFSKGLCSCAKSTPVITATLSSSSASVTLASSLAGIYNGMSVTGTGIAASTTVSAVNPAAGTFTLSNNATASGAQTLTFSGGQYLIQFGRQAGIQLDTYNHLLGLNYNWDEIANNLAQAGSTPAVPAAPSIFLIGNQTKIATIPGTATSKTTDSTLTIQCGTFSAGTFLAANPDSGSMVRLGFTFTRSGAI